MTTPKDPTTPTDTPPQSAKKKPRGKPFQRGTDARRGRGPEKGAPNAGSPTKVYKMWLAARLADPKHQMAFIRALNDDQHPAFAAATKHAAAYAHGAPAQSVTLDGEGLQVVIVGGAALARPEPSDPA